jgi:cholesterol oxidase
MASTPDVMSYDVIIVGSGFGGSICASRLAQAGVKVLVLERGPWRDSLPVRAMGIADRAPFPYGARFATHLLRDVHLGRGSGKDPAGRPAAPGYSRHPGILGMRSLQRLIGSGGRSLRLNSRGMYEIFSYPGIDVLCASGVGGGSHGWLGMLVEPPAGYWDNRHPELDPAQISQQYGKITADMGATRLTREHPVPNTVWAQLPGRPEDRCQPADPQPESAYLYPRSEAETGRLAGNGGPVLRRFCAFDGDTFLGSASGARASVDFTYLAPVLGNGATVRDLCEVRRIARESSSAGDRYAVHYRDLRSRKEASVRARRVILAAGTMNTLRLLFAGQARHDLAAMPALGRTFGGNSDFLGFWFKDSANPPMFVSPPVLGRFTVDNAETPYLGLVGTCGLDTLPLPARARRRLANLVLVLGMGADSGSASARFERGRLEISYDGSAEPVFDRLREGLAALEADSELKTSAWQKPITVHAWGGARLGPDPEHGVVDHNGEVYGNPGVYVADAAALPAAAGVPPSLAIAAWAHHLADRLAGTIPVGARTVAAIQPAKGAS